MKRLCIIFLLVLSMIISVPKTINAGFNPKTEPKPTERRNAFEFCELYATRYHDFRSEGAEIFDPLVPVIKTDDGIFVSVTAGLLCLDPETFSVNSLDMTFQSPLFSDDTNQRNIINFLTALSALEYDYEAGKLMPYETMLTGKIYNPITKAMKLWDDVIIPAYEGSQSKSQSNKGEKFLIYSANYDYYLVCTEYKNYYVYSVIAESRQ